jgi:hypothetical protein
MSLGFSPMMSYGGAAIEMVTRRYSTEAADGPLMGT